MSNLLKKAKGFTLIEIVLVLAIAGLIMVIVFLALSGAEKSQRDTQRKNDLGQIAAALENYASNNSGQYPTAANFATSFGTGGTYNNTNWKDPLSNSTYTFAYSAAAPATPTTGTAAGVNFTIVNGRSYNVCIGLEQGGFTCRSNQ